MAEFAYNPIQTIAPGQNAIMDTVIPCSKGYVYHRNQSGLVTLRGVVNNPSACFARYQVTANANIALSDGATVTPISAALAIDGEPIQTSNAIVTPAAANQYFNITSTALITVPRGCCFTVAVENTSAPVDGVAPEINMQNLNVTVFRIA